MKRLTGVGFWFLLCCMAFFSCATTTVRKEGSVNPEIQNIYSASVTIINCDKKKYGSGTIIHNRKGQQMFVLTAAHVVKAIQKKNEKVCVSTAFDTKKRQVKIYKIDDKVDLAIVYTEEMEKRAGPEVDISLYGPNIGDKVWVIGAPLGRDRTVTNGIVSNFQDYKGKVLYRTTAATYYGNSGGGMFNADGQLIGVAHGVLEIQRTMFSTQLVPGGFFFVGLETIRKFM